MAVCIASEDYLFLGHCKYSSPSQAPLPQARAGGELHPRDRFDMPGLHLRSLAPTAIRRRTPSRISNRERDARSRSTPDAGTRSGSRQLRQPRAGPLRYLIPVGHHHPPAAHGGQLLPLRPVDQRRHLAPGTVDVEAAQHDRDHVGIGGDELDPRRGRSRQAPAPSAPRASAGRSARCERWKGVAASHSSRRADVPTDPPAGPPDQTMTCCWTTAAISAAISVTVCVAVLLASLSAREGL